MTDTLPDNDGQWYSTRLAAVHLGVTERTIQRRIASGRYRTDRVDGNVRIWLPVAVGHEPDRSSDTIHPESDIIGITSGDVRHLPDTAIDFSATVRRALDMLAEERERAAAADARASQAEQSAAMWQERAHNLEEETKRLYAQLALPPTQPESVPSTDPVEELRAKVDELTQRLQTQPDTVIPRRWWQRWRRG